MTDDRTQDQRQPEATLSALGQPAGYPLDTDTGSPDFASEHEDTAVDKSITAGKDKQRETESPRSWAGMD